jgi:hypothetical protein
LISNNKTQYCPFCGIAIEQDSKFCHNCGASLENQTINQTKETPSVKIISESPLHEHPEIDTTPLRRPHLNGNSGYATVQNQTTTTYTHYPRKKQNDTQGFFSLLFAILSFVGILPFIGSILAIILGGKNAGPLGIVGRTMGLISLFFLVIFGFMILL